MSRDDEITFLRSHDKTDRTSFQLQSYENKEAFSLICTKDNRNERGCQSKIGLLCFYSEKNDSKQASEDVRLLRGNAEYEL